MNFQKAWIEALTVGLHRMFADSLDSPYVSKTLVQISWIPRDSVGALRRLGSVLNISIGNQ